MGSRLDRGSRASSNNYQMLGKIGNMDVNLWGKAMSDQLHATVTFFKIGT